MNARAPDDGQIWKQGVLALAGELTRAPGALADLQSQGCAALADTCLPDSSTEFWKYSSARAFARSALQRPPPAPEVAPAEPLLAGNLVIQLLDGAMHMTAAPPPGMQVLRLSEAQGSALQLARHRLGTLADMQQPFTALNSALAQDVLLLLIAPGAHIDMPVELILHAPVAQGQQGQAMAHPRLLCVVGEGAHLTLVEHQQASPDSGCVNTLLEIFAEDGAAVDHYRLMHGQDSAHWLTALAVKLQAQARYGLYQVQTGGSFRRSEISVHLSAPGAVARVAGISLGHHQHRLDTRIRMQHEQGQCVSEQVFRAAAGGRAQVTVDGQIHIHPHAQGTDAHLNTGNLLLSADAQINIKPQLEIYADDVACSHGATVGHLDERALFYLRSRGVGAPQARMMLARSFLVGVLQRFAHPALAARIEQELLHELQQLFGGDR